MKKKVKSRKSDEKSQPNSGFLRKHTLALFLIVAIAIGVLMLSSSILSANQAAQPINVQSASGEVRFTVAPKSPPPYAESQGTGGVVSFVVVKN